MPIALGDVGEGIDETAGGQLVGTNFQHAPIEQTLLQHPDRLPGAVERVGRQQAQFAVDHDLVERSMRFDRRQAAKLEKAVVPQLQRTLGADHRHTLRQAVDGSLQQARLLRQRLLAAHGFTDLDLGDVGIEHHQAAFLGRPLADLHPATVVEAVHGRLVTLAAVFFDDQPGAFGQPAHFGQARSGIDARAGTAPQRLEAAIEQHDALIAVEQHEGVGNALDGVDQMLMRRLGAQARVAEQTVAGLELGHGLVQRIGALADLLGQLHRMLEGCIGRIAPRAAALDALDQGGVDATQFLVFAFELGQPGQRINGHIVLLGGQWRRR